MWQTVLLENFVPPPYSPSREEDCPAQKGGARSWRVLRIQRWTREERVGPSSLSSELSPWQSWALGRSPLLPPTGHSRKKQYKMLTLGPADVGKGLRVLKWTLLPVCS